MKDCCQETSNLKSETLADNFVCRTCLKCGAKHYELDVEPAILDMTGKELG